ncbi:hypothetical protein LEP1GSC037_5575 [Leptospira interrogans str. 2006001854]|uniref:Uncharacterized protein n=1 Tax=Leptospira interrogans str. 2006001854 TaxID=1001590 RepID=M6GLR2_LEPIR|nr:hypothetical protein LEP1GSC037_5575 [Leptospira interrogans str. 2006001854]
MYKEYRKNINSVRKFHDELNVQKKTKEYLFEFTFIIEVFKNRNQYI